MWIPDAHGGLCSQCSRRGRNHEVAMGTFVLKTDKQESLVMAIA